MDNKIDAAVTIRAVNAGGFPMKNVRCQEIFASAENVQIYI